MIKFYFLATQNTNNTKGITRRGNKISAYFFIYCILIFKGKRNAVFANIFE